MLVGQYHKRERRILYTTPPVLTIEENYTISRPVQITVPYFSDYVSSLPCFGDANQVSAFTVITNSPLQLPKCVAYFGPAKVEGVFSAHEGGDSEQGGVQLKWTGSEFCNNRS